MSIYQKPKNFGLIAVAIIAILAIIFYFFHAQCEKNNTKLTDLKYRIDSIENMLSFKRDSFDKLDYNSKSYQLVIKYIEELETHDEALNEIRRDQKSNCFSKSGKINQVDGYISATLMKIKDIKVPKKKGPTPKRNNLLPGKVRYEKILSSENSAICEEKKTKDVHKYYFDLKNNATDLNVQFSIPNNIGNDSIVCGLVENDTWRDIDNVGFQKLHLKERCCFKQVISQIRMIIPRDQVVVRIGFKVFHKDGTASIIREPQVWLFFSECE